MPRPGSYSPDPGNVRVIEPATAGEFGQYYELRWKILRAPWNQPRGSERDPRDTDASHFMLIDETQRLLGVGRLHFNTIREAQIRYMAIDTRYQRRGLGSRLLNAMEERARSLGAASITLDARESALGFYCKHGYTALGTGHVLFDRIAHMRMKKNLVAPVQGR